MTTTTAANLTEWTKRLIARGWALSRISHPYILDAARAADGVTMACDLTLDRGFNRTDAAMAEEIEIAVRFARREMEAAVLKFNAAMDAAEMAAREIRREV